MKPSNWLLCQSLLYCSLANIIAMSIPFKKKLSALNMEAIGDFAERINRPIAIMLIVKKLVRLTKAPAE